VNKEEIIYSALEAMKEQDALLNVQQQLNPKVIMSIETYEQMQKDPEAAKDICSRILSIKNNSLKETEEFLKKW
jgi:L-lactate utilization protein LutB